MKSGPHLSLLLAIFFTGVVLLLASGKGHLPPLAGAAGNVLMGGVIAWLVFSAARMSGKTY